MYPSEAFSALADFNVLVCQAKARARSDLLRASPTTHGAKLLVAATAVRAYRNRHLSTLIRCCEVWELVGQCLVRITFECTTFHARSHIIASLTRGNITERTDPIFFCNSHDCLRHYNQCTRLATNVSGASSRNPAQFVTASNRSQRSLLHSGLLMFSSTRITGVILDCFKIVCKVVFAG